MRNSSATDVLHTTGRFDELGGAGASTVGSFGGECFRATCHNYGADWHHRAADRYYCASCAADLNLASKLKGEPAVCTRHR